MNKRLILIASLALTGCTGGSRYCGTFDIPQSLSWSTVDNIGESATFTNASGENLTLTLLSREDNEPFDSYNRDGADSAVCEKYSQRRYVYGDDDAGLLIRITQWESLGVPFEDQIISFRTVPEAPSGAALDYDFSFGTDRLEFYADGETSSTQSIRTLSDTFIGDVSYELAIEDVYTDTTGIDSATPDGIEVVSGLVFAREAAGVRDGLVRIDFTNGESYTRVN